VKYDITVDGVTQGLTGMWLECRKKAFWWSKGYTPKAGSLALTYGGIGHAVLQLVYEDIQMRNLDKLPDTHMTKSYIHRVEKAWRKDNPRADKKSLEYLELSLLIAEATLPAYFRYWYKDLKEMKWQKVENSFAVPLQLGKDEVIFRGKMDGVFLSSPTRMWLFETKFKGQIDEESLVDILPMDFQVLIYLLVLSKLARKTPAGVLYNVIRRSGLRQKVGESLPQFAKRCAEDIEKRPDHYFLRLEISITPSELKKFEEETLTPMIHDFIGWAKNPEGLSYRNSNSCNGRYGRCKYLPLCAGMKTSLFTKRDRVFPELEAY